MQRRVLLVEDESLIRLWLADCLLEAGFDVIDIGNGEQAIGLIDGCGAFDLLITDIPMPGCADGNVVARRAKQRCPGLPVIYSTGSSDGLRNQLEACDALLVKPYTGATLLATAQRLLDGRRGPLCGFGWGHVDLGPAAGIAVRVAVAADAATASSAR
jgi:CheY-like chemotaxis protein